MTVMSHIKDERLIDFTNQTLEESDRRSVEEHLHGCAECRGAAASLADFERELAIDASWLPADDSSPVRSAKLDDLRRIVDADSSPAVAELRQRLTQLRLTAEHDPAQSLREAEEVSALADGVGSDIPRAMRQEFRATAQRERANALRLLGRYPEALEAANGAMNIVAADPAAGFQRALIGFVRATILWLLQRHSDAMSEAAQAAATFAEFGDLRREAHARTLIGGILFEQGDARAARELFLEQVMPLQASDDGMTLGAIYNNLAHCSLQLGEREAAATWFLQALRLADEMKFETMKGNVQWGLARLRLAAGSSDEALARFKEAERAFLQVSMSTQAALVGLESVELRLALGATKGIATRCRELVDRFRAAGLPKNASAALAYLEEAAAADRLEPRLVQHVRLYLDDVRTQPELLFAQM